LYLNLVPENYAGTKYKVERVTGKKYENVPCLYKILNPRCAKYALKLIGEVMKEHGLQFAESQTLDYYVSGYSYETTDALIGKGLVKEIKKRETYEKYMQMKRRFSFARKIGEDK